VAGQTPDSAATRAAYDAGIKLEAEYEREHGHTVLVNGLQMHYLEWGDAKGVPLIWAHGSMGTAFEMRALAPGLVAAGYRLIAPCLRGQGRSQVDDYRFTIYHQADDLAAMMDQLEIPAAVFGGGSKGGFVAAAVYDQYPRKVLGLLLHDGGSWSNQIMFDIHGTERFRRIMEGGGPPAIEGSDRFEVFRQLVGGRSVPPERAVDLLANINRRPNGRWAFMAGFRDMMGTIEQYLGSATAPSTAPPLQFSQNIMNPLVVFRNLDVPMMIIDPQDADTTKDELPVTDQNIRLKALHPDLIVHQIYRETQHAAFRQRPDWVIRDATTLLDLVKRRPARRLPPDRGR
jgi:pimeloyl-ACP methyl ester carboxylesterase